MKSKDGEEELRFTQECPSTLGCLQAWQTRGQQWNAEIGLDSFLLTSPLVIETFDELRSWGPTFACSVKAG